MAYAGCFGDLNGSRQGRTKQVSDPPMAYQAGSATVYFFPRAISDPILDILGTVGDPVNGQPACYGNPPGCGTADGRTVIRIAMHQISHVEVAKKLWDLDGAGCYVDIVYRGLDTNGSAVLDRLTRSTKFGGIALHRLTDTGAAGNTATHSRYLLVEVGHKGLPNQKIVWTGSHPHTVMGLTSNDEALLKYDDPAIHDAYRSNSWARRAAADAQTAKQPVFE
ncbi:hypothetical protein [Streptomyces sp. NPDC001450]